MRFLLGLGHGYLVLHETQRGKNTYAQADHSLQSALESGVNSDTNRGAYYVNPIKKDRLYLIHLDYVRVFHKGASYLQLYLISKLTA